MNGDGKEYKTVDCSFRYLRRFQKKSRKDIDNDLYFLAVSRISFKPLNTAFTSNLRTKAQNLP